MSGVLHSLDGKNLPINKENKMSEFKKHKHDRRPDTDREPKQMENEEEDKWNPTPETFQAFLVRDEQLAAGNIQIALRNSRGPISFKELKDSVLHSSALVERVLNASVADGSVLESKGRYSLPTRATR